MDDVDVAGTSVSSVKAAILDSGTSLLVGPTEDVKAIAAKVVREGSWINLRRLFLLFLLSCRGFCVWCLFDPFVPARVVLVE